MRDVRSKVLGTAPRPSKDLIDMCLHGLEIAAGLHSIPQPWLGIRHLNDALVPG